MPEKNLPKKKFGQTFLESLLNRYTKDTLEKKKELVNFKKFINNPSLILNQTFLRNFYYKYIGIDENDIITKAGDFQAMFRDPILSNALGLIVDDAIAMSGNTGKRIWSVADDESTQKNNDELFNLLGIQEKIEFIATKLGLLGNCPVRIYYQNEEQTAEGSWDVSGGISYIEIEENIYRYIPIEIQGVLVKYYDRYRNQILEPFQVKFFKLNSVVDYQVFDNYYNISLNSINYNLSRNTFRYGTSLFENVRRLWRQLKLLEDNMILTRMERSGKVRIFKVGVNADSKPQDVQDLLDFYATLLTTDNRVASLTDDIMKSNPAQAGFGTNIILPKYGDQDISIDDFGGDAEVADIVDIDYFRKKFYAALKVPASFLGMTDDLPGSLGESALVRLEIRYARMVKKMQYALQQGMKDILFWHNMSLDHAVNYEDFDVMMAVVSTAEDEEQKSALKSSVETVQGLTQLLNDLQAMVAGGTLTQQGQDNLFDYISRNIMNTVDFNWKDFFNKQQAQEPGMGGGMGGGMGDMGMPEEIGPSPAEMGGEEIGASPAEEQPINAGMEEPTPIASKTVRLAKKPDLRPKMSNNPIPNLMFFSTLASLNEETRNNIIKKIDKLSTKSHAPKFEFDSHLAYTRDIMMGDAEVVKKKRYMAEMVDKTLDKKDLKKHIGEMSAFDVTLFGYGLDKQDLSIVGMDTKMLTEKVKEEELCFTESLYQVQDILNYKTDGKIVVYKKEGKNYLSYTDGLAYFNCLISEKVRKFTVIEITPKQEQDND